MRIMLNCILSEVRKLAKKLYGVMMEPEMDVRINALLKRGDSKSAWVRDAIEAKLVIEEGKL